MRGRRAPPRRMLSLSDPYLSRQPHSCYVAQYANAPAEWGEYASTQHNAGRNIRRQAGTIQQFVHCYQPQDQLIATKNTKMHKKNYIDICVWITEQVGLSGYSCVRCFCVFSCFSWPFMPSDGETCCMVPAKIRSQPNLVANFVANLIDSNVMSPSYFDKVRDKGTEIANGLS